jgi:hypothetical protein
MVVIESARFGDEQEMRDVTKVLNDRIESGTIKVPVDDKLIPPFEVVEKATLSNDEDRKIREQATKACGGPDKTCVAIRTSELRQQALLEKTTQADSEAAVIKGDRLAITTLDATGKRKNIVVPAGQTFSLTGLSAPVPETPADWYAVAQNTFISFASISIATLLWVFGVVATFVLFSGVFKNEYVGAAFAFLAVIFPGLGYFMIVLYFGGQSFIENYTTNV